MSGAVITVSNEISNSRRSLRRGGAVTSAALERLHVKTDVGGETRGDAELSPQHRARRSQ